MRDLLVPTATAIDEDSATESDVDGIVSMSGNDNVD